MLPAGPPPAVGWSSLSMMDSAVGHARLVGRAHDQRVGAALDDHRGRAALARHARHRGGGAVDQLLHRLHDVGGDRVLQRHDLQLAAGGLVERGDDLAQALQVVGVVGDDQRVVAGARVDRVVGGDQRTQHGHEVVRVLVVELEDLRQHHVAALRRRAHRHRAGLQLRVGLGHHLQEAARLHHREAQAAQRRQVVAIGLAQRLRLVVVDGDVALDARVDQDVAIEHGADGARDGLDVGVDEVQRHGRAARARGRHRGVVGGAAARRGLGDGGDRVGEQGDRDRGRVQTAESSRRFVP